MKSKDLKDVHQYSPAKIKSEIEKLEQELVEVNIKKQLNQLKDLHQLTSLRHDIARLKTILTQKELVSKDNKVAESKEEK